MQASEAVNAQKLLEIAKAAPNVPQAELQAALERRNSAGWTPLMLASYGLFSKGRPRPNYKLSCVKTLLSLKADPQARHSALGSTALFFAAQTDTDDVIQALVLARADPMAAGRPHITNARAGSATLTPLQEARRSKATRAVRLLEARVAQWRGTLLYEEHGAIAGAVGRLFGGDKAGQVTSKIGGTWKYYHAVVIRNGPMQEIALYQISGANGTPQAVPVLLIPLSGRFEMQVTNTRKLEFTIPSHQAKSGGTLGTVEKVLTFRARSQTDLAQVSSILSPGQAQPAAAPAAATAVAPPAPISPLPPGLEYDPALDMPPPAYEAPPCDFIDSKVEVAPPMHAEADGDAFLDQAMAASIAEQSTRAVQQRKAEEADFQLALELSRAEAAVDQEAGLEFPSAPVATTATEPLSNRDERKAEEQSVGPHVMGDSAPPARVATGGTMEEPPDAFVCPISFELMLDPVMCSDGHTYERAAIEDWLSSHTTSPKTNEELQTTALFPNHNLRAAIDEYLKHRA